MSEAGTRQILSGSTAGRPISIDADSTPGTLIHEATDVRGRVDEVWLYATNTSGSDVLLTIEAGGVTDPDDLIEVTVSASGAGLSLVLPGLPYDDVSVRAFAATADVVNVTGFVTNIDTLA